MDIKIKDKKGIKLKTKDKFVTEDINVLVDESILGGGGSGGLQIEKINFTKNYSITINGSEVQTFSYQATEEKYNEILNIIQNGVRVQGIPPIGTFVVGDESSEFIIIGSWGIGGEDGTTDVTDYAGNSLITLAFDSGNKIIFLKSFIIEDMEILDQFISVLEEFYISIPKE